VLTAAASYVPLLAQVLTVARLGSMALSGGRKKSSPRACAQVDSSSSPAISSPRTFSMLKNGASRLPDVDPLPERRAEVEAVVQVLRLDKNV
jgi:hypothetical protein